MKNISLRHRQILKAILLLMAVLLAMMSVNAIRVAALSPKGSLTVLLENKREEPISGMQVLLCKIADFDGYEYLPSMELASSGISIDGILSSPDDYTARSVRDYIVQHDVTAKETISLNGKAFFSDLDQGIWLAYCAEEQAYTFEPFLVFIPYTINGEMSLDLVSSPKTDDALYPSRNVYVVKKWEDKNNVAKTRPSDITVELLRDGEVLESVILNEGNGWAHTFNALPKEGAYTVREVPVTDYKTQIDGDAMNGYVITNTYIGEKLPQTGQIWIPVILIALCGVGCIVLGVMQMGKRKKNDGK